MRSSCSRLRFTSYESSDMRLIAFPSREIYVFAVVIANESRVYISERHGQPRGLGSVSDSTRIVSTQRRFYLSVASSVCRNQVRTKGHNNQQQHGDRLLSGASNERVTINSVSVASVFISAECATAATEESPPWHSLGRAMRDLKGVASIRSRLLYVV